MAIRDEYLNNIRRQLSVLKEEVRLNNRVNRQGLNISCEDILGGLLNRIYDWQLQNANDGRQNYPAIDLADWEEGVVVQVSSDTSGTKIKETLAKLQGPAFADARLHKLVMLFLAPKLKYTTVFEHDGLELELMDLDDISRCVEHLTGKKLREISGYLDEELGRLTAPLEKPRYLLPGVPTPTPSFVEGSRDGELELLDQALERGPVFLWGLGGIGKTETAIQLAKRAAPPKGAYFLHYYHDAPDGVEALRETILRANFAGYRFEGRDDENRDAEYKERMDILRTEFAGAMVIIDNFDRPGRTLADLRGEPAYRELTAMDIRLVFTTRNEVPLGGVEIRPLTEADLLTLMRKSCTSRAVSDADLLELIRAVEGHTLMADLMAKTLRESLGAVTPRTILEAFQKDDLKRQDLPEVYKEQQERSGQGRMDHHLRTLFDLSAMNRAERSVLRCATLLPEDGMNALLFKNCLSDTLPEEPGGILRRVVRKLFAAKTAETVTEQQAFTRLTKTGWLAVSAENLLTIHPVIREVCREELKPTDETCWNFLARLWNRYDIDREYDADRFLDAAKCFSMASDRLEDREGHWACRAGQLWNELGQAQTALRYDLRMAEQRKQNLPPDCESLAIAYNNVGTTYGLLGARQKELEYIKRSLTISKKIYTSKDPKLATVYDNLGQAYGKLGDQREALKCQKIALSIYEKTLPFDHPDLATAYNNVGITYNTLEDHGKALEYMKKALTICEKILPPDHPDLARSYQNMGIVYDGLGNHEEALEYKLKALAIQEKILPPDHPDLATSYNNVGFTYGQLGNDRKALEYIEKSLVIWDSKLLPDHPDLATAYNNVGSTYGALGDHGKALEYQEKALAIREKVLPPNHPDLAASYHNVGIDYANQGDYRYALEYLERALAIYEKALPPDHPHIASTKESIENVRSWLE